MPAPHRPRHGAGLVPDADRPYAQRERSIGDASRGMSVAKWPITKPVLGLAALMVMAAGIACGDETGADTSIATPSTVMGQTRTLELPAPDTEGQVSLEEAIRDRRSIRDYTDGPLSLIELGQLLWAAQGITSDREARAAPSAGGTYPLELYVAAGRVTGLEPGVYRYLPHEHALDLVTAGDVRGTLMEASLGQTWVGDCAAGVIVAAVYERTMERYGERGIRYVHMEAGHAAQNLCLQAVALGLGAVPVGAFADEQIQAVAGLAADEQPLYVIPVGRPQAP